MTQPKQSPMHRGVLGAVVGGAALAVLPLVAAAAPPGDLPFGAYDPTGGFSDDPDVQIEHLFLPWEDIFLPSLLEADAYAQERGRSVLVTIEPWTWSRSERNTATALIEGIFDGSYDSNLRAICGTLADFDSPVTIRWAQEMDDTSGQFIWAQWRPETYIAAYQRVVDICRETSDRFDFMWSPLGFETLAEFYPGDDYVDVIGLSVFGLQAWEQEILGAEQSFHDIFKPRYERALQFDLPIVVAELGYVGDADYVTDWNETVRQDLEDYPELQAVVYFNQKEVYPWPDGYGLPDWRFPQNTLGEVQAALGE
ncbi:glycoside hydrolase family 26 protein [Epibacterium sp. Ofav1-8]|uniref:glycoside hydrolase family 26 protein n=1 Tax=Epibacterium sp. Ofav1-8 TaxID=2917735 RepID=UPI001EF5BE1B|nr:glycosyl hydrolase [Epibacterium sp. Ofav1-8]MCG7623468.1 beta-mannosidase [Epibacterium sp. Ofav1-8]